MDPARRSALYVPLPGTPGHPRPALPVAGNPSPILTGLNSAQAAAVTAPANVVQILAPPGSGKTRTLTSRVAYLLSDAHGYAPQNIIVATFTVKAAREMRERLSALVGNGVESKLLMGTFHSIAFRYLKRYGHLIGLKPGWTIADSADSTAICKRIIKRRSLPLEPKAIRTRISYTKACNSGPITKHVVAPPSTIPATPTSKTKKSVATNAEFIMLYEDYQAALELQNQLDYDDLLLRCLELLRSHPECVNNIEAVLIDEFQDTNVVQFDLMRKLATRQGRITIVGDPDQSIYSFRAAEIGNLKMMRRAYPDTLVINLEENYRSSASILHAAIEIIRQDDSRPDKPLMPTHAVGTSPVLRKTINAVTEAQWIAAEIKRIRAVTAGLLRLSDIAILVRAANLTQRIETALVKEGIGYRMVGGHKFFDRIEVKIVLDYLRVLHNPANNDALHRILNKPARGLGELPTFLLEAAENCGSSMWDIICSTVRDGKWPSKTKLTKLAPSGLGQFKGIIESMMKAMDGETRQSLVEIVEILLKKLKYADWLQAHYPEDIETRWANVQELLSQARDFNFTDEDDALPEIEGVQQHAESRNPLYTALERFLANAALTSETDKDKEADDAGAVTIMTIHAAKGLEWPAVFVPAVYDGNIPHSRTDNADEERRLLYVAMTRAQALLYMSCPQSNSNREKVKLSPFLDDKRVTRLLARKAPYMSFSSVQTLACILRLPCPSEAELRRAIEKSGIPSEKDDLIPEKDPTSDEDGNGDCNEKTRKWLPVQQSADLQTVEGKRAGWKGFTTTEDLAKRNLTTVEKLSFQSATSHLLELQRQDGVITCEAERAATERMKSHKKMMSSATSVTTKSETKLKEKPGLASRSKLKPATGGGSQQQSITGFFKKKEVPPQPAAPVAASKRSVMTATEVVRTFHQSDIALSEQMLALPPPVIPTRSAAEFILLSSSPPRQPTPKRPKIMGRGDKSRGDSVQNTELPSSPTFAAFCQEMDEDSASLLPRLPDVLPRKISITQRDKESSTKSSATPTTTTSSVGSVKPKRTLGIKRSMNGWKSRGRRF